MEFYGSGEGVDPFQSGPVCVLYQNKDYVVLGITNKLSTTIIEERINTRVLTLSREQSVGFAPVPVQDAIMAYVDKCELFTQLGWYY